MARRQGGRWVAESQGGREVGGGGRERGRQGGRLVAGRQVGEGGREVSDRSPAGPRPVSV